MSLRDLNTAGSVEEWAKKNCLNNHPLIVEKLEELRAERVEISDDELPCMEINIPRECAVLTTDSVTLQEYSDKTPNDELIARGSVKIKKFRREDSTSLLTRNPVKDREEDFYHFYGKKSPFSNFHPAKFILEGVEYRCSEQYMMHQKAVLFRDNEKAQQILSTTDPLTMKRLGRKVNGFRAKVWSSQCVNIVKRGVTAKFKQNPHLERALIETFPKILAEASPSDRLWGIGLGLQDKPQINNRKTWRGKNRLGYLLTDVRNEIMSENGMFDQ